MNGKPPQAIDFRETAPAATHREFYLKLDKTASQDGGAAVGVPGFPAGLYELHKKYGKLKWDKLFDDAIQLAEKGFPVSGEWVETAQENFDRFDAAAKKAFFKKDGSSYKPGETLKQPGLAKALMMFKARGPKAFYEGPVAQDIVDSANATGGKFTMQDLKNYKVRWLAPLQVKYEGHDVYLMPPPSSGGIVIAQALKLIETLDVKKKPALGIEEFHMLAEIQSRAFRGRALLGDPDFHKNPVTFLTSDTYLKEMAQTINPKKTVALKPLNDSEIKESTQTTNYTIMDAQGNAIALTVTLNGNYGSGVVTKKFGINLNNEMDDFTTRPGEPNMYGLIQGAGNEVQAGKRPLSSMSPTIIEKNGKTVLAIGAPGGPRIITGVLLGIYRIIGRQTDIDLAIQAPRVHHQFLPQKLMVDHGRFSPEILEGLKAKGHIVEETWMAKVNAVRLRDDGVLEAAFDSRAEGAAGGQ
jgi:gamma-glutamyltranspeptidase / glutathione hydrolase